MTTASHFGFDSNSDVSFGAFSVHLGQPNGPGPSYSSQPQFEYIQRSVFYPKVEHMQPLSIIAPSGASCIQSCSASACGPLLIPKEPNNNNGNKELSASPANSSLSSSSISNYSSTDGESSTPSISSRVIVRLSAKKRKEDDEYWERRRKNNDAAKKSRDQRRVREDEIALRAEALERENAVLRSQLEQLREETKSLHRILFRNSSALQMPSASVITSTRDTVLVPPARRPLPPQ